MNYGTYCRIESAAGGVGCTVREFIRAARAKLTYWGKSRDAREDRHEWLRKGLKHREDARKMYREVVTGRLG